MGAWDSLSIREKADMMKAAIRNGITTLPEIKQAYNEFAEGGNIYGGGGQKKSGGSFYQTHRARWFNFLRKKGVDPVKAERLASYFSAQDALESGHGTSSAARQKNNYGGMQRLDKKTNKMVNVSYGSIDDYMNAKWKMMNSKYSRALNAKSIQEYANILNDPKYHGKAYMYGLYEGYRDGQPLDVARQTKYMNDYTRIMMDIAGEKGFKGAAVPEGIGSDDLSIVQPENPYTQFIPFEPFNPQAFGAPQAFVAPTREEFEIEQPLVEAAKDYAYSPEQLEKEERRQGLNNLSFILGMMNGGNGSSFADTIGMLTGNIAAEGGKIHIKPENRGKFTALKKRTGHSATWFKEHGTPAQKKMATFALNARHWKHGLGGNLYLFGGDDDNNPRPVTTGGAGYIPPVVDDPVAQTRKYLYTHILPISDYNIKETINGALEGEFEYRKRNEPKFDYEKEYPKNTDYTTIGGTKAPLSVVDGIWADYLQIPQKDRKKFVGPTIQQSKYKPSSGGRSDINYYSLPLTRGAESLLVKEGMGLPIGKNKVTDTLEKYGNTVFNLGDHTIGRGKDNKGDYISYYDVFDLNPFSDKYNGTDIPLLNKLNDASFGIGKPVHIYDRIYLDDYYGVPSPYRGGIYLPEVTITGKKRRKGRKHGYGGHIYDGTTEDTQQMNIPYVGELPDVEILGKKRNNVLRQVTEHWVTNDKGEEVPTYWGYNPTSKQYEQLYKLTGDTDLENSVFSTYDNRHTFNVPQATEMRKAYEQWVKNGANANGLDEVMVGTLGLSLTPIALPEIAAGVTAASDAVADAVAATPWGQTAIKALNTPFGKTAINTLLAYPGLNNFFSSEGYQKTANAFNEGRYGDAALSAVGDALDLSMAAPLAKNAFTAGDYISDAIKNLYRNYPIRNYNIDAIIKSDFYNEVSKQYGKDFADDLAQRLTSKEFRKYLFGDNPRKAYKAGEKHLEQMEFIDDVENAGGLLGGSGQLARKGTVKREGLLHDLDFFVPGSMEERSSSVIDALGLNKHNKPNLGALTPTGVKPKVWNNVRGSIEEGYINLPQERGNVTADMFIRSEMPTDKESADVILNAKRQFGRPKDLADIENFVPYSKENPIIDIATGEGQWNPTLFDKGIFTEEGYPFIQSIETYPGSGVRVPAVMNYRGQIKALGTPVEARIPQYGLYNSGK